MKYSVPRLTETDERLRDGVMRFEERELKPYAEPVLPGVYSEAQELPEQRTTACKCLINAVVSMGRRNTQLEPTLH